MKKILLIILGVYIISVMYCLLFPLPDFTIVNRWFPHKMNFTPFATINSILTNRPNNFAEQLYGNIFLFAPLALLIPFIFSKISVSKLFVIGLCIVLLAEPLQYIAGLVVGYNYRSIDIDDTILNIFGYIIFFGIAVLVQNFFKKSR